MTLFHGSHEDSLTAVDTRIGIFDGIFASDYTAARSHGRHVYEVLISDAEILSQQTMRYDIDFDRIVEALRGDCGEHAELVADALTDGIEQAYEGSELFDGIVECRFLEENTFAYVGWELQRLRGVIAKTLGYKAVECNDEHGTSYLVLPGVVLKKV